MRSKTALLTILLTFLLQLPSLALAYEWEARQGFQGWGFHNVGNIRFTAEGAIIDKQPDSGDFGLSLPAGITRGASFVKVHLRARSIDSLVSCILLAGERVVASQKNPLFSGGSWKEEVFDFSSAHLTAPVDMVVLSFRHCDSVELRDLTVTGPSFTEVFALQGLRIYNVNSLYPFTLYGYSLNLWLYGFIIISVLGITLFSGAKRKKHVVVLAGIIFFISYVTLDMREAWEEFKIIGTTYEDYLSAPPGDKSFHWHDNLVEFSDLIRSTVRTGEGPAYFFGDETRYLYMRYLLYPLKLVRNRETPGGVNVFSEIDDVVLTGNNIIVSGRVLVSDGRGIAYSPHSFLYLMP